MYPVCVCSFWWLMCHCLTKPEIVNGTLLLVSSANILSAACQLVTDQTLKTSLFLSWWTVVDQRSRMCNLCKYFTCLACVNASQPSRVWTALKLYTFITLLCVAVKTSVWCWGRFVTDFHISRLTAFSSQETETTMRIIGHKCFKSATIILLCYLL